MPNGCWAFDDPCRDETCLHLRRHSHPHWPLWRGLVWCAKRRPGCTAPQSANGAPRRPGEWSAPSTDSLRSTGSMRSNNAVPDWRDNVTPKIKARHWNVAAVSIPIPLKIWWRVVMKGIYFVWTVSNCTQRIKSLVRETLVLTNEQKGPHWNCSAATVETKAARRALIGAVWKRHCRKRH